MNYRRNLLIVLLLASYPMVVLISQEINMPELKGYRKITDYPVYTRDNLWTFINGAADTYLSYGFIDLNVCEYKKGKNIIKLEIYRYNDNVGAFGIYSTERSSGFRFLSIGAQGYSSGGILNFFKGSFYVKLRTNSGSGKVLQSLNVLAMRVASILPGENVMPKTLGEFPVQGRLMNEEAYIYEGVLGHKFLDQAFMARYEADGSLFSVYIFDKDTEEECRNTVTAYLEETGGELDDAAGGKYLVKDGYNGDIFLAWKENRIVIISGLAKDQADIADRYTSQILK